jgi:hypothetical protein
MEMADHRTLTDLKMDHDSGKGFDERMDGDENRQDLHRGPSEATA